MINPHWLELPMSGINFHGPKDFRVIEVWLFVKQIAAFYQHDLFTNGHLNPHKGYSQDLSAVEAKFLPKFLHTHVSYAGL